MPEQHLEFLTEIPAKYHLDYCHLYASREYIKNLNAPICSYAIVHPIQKEILVTIHFQLMDQNAQSLKHAPFGGFNFHKAVNPEVLESFLLFILSDLRTKHLKQVTIKNAPSIYLPEGGATLVDEILCRLQFENIRTEINHHLEVTNTAFTTHIKAMEKRKLLKCMASGFSFKKASLSQLRDIYQFTLSCRQEKSQEQSMDFEALKKAIETTPDAYLLFTVYDKAVLIASSICVVVNKKILYHFYPASTLSYNSFSPMVFLLSHIYDYCNHHGFKILDLGTSMLEEFPNHSLIKFKENLGGQLTRRSIYELKL